MGAIADAAAREDSEGMLIALRDELAKQLDDGVPARELASVSKRLMEIVEELKAVRAEKLADDPLSEAIREAAQC